MYFILNTQTSKHEQEINMCIAKLGARKKKKKKTFLFYFMSHELNHLRLSHFHFLILVKDVALVQG